MGFIQKKIYKAYIGICLLITSLSIIFVLRDGRIDYSINVTSDSTEMLNCTHSYSSYLKKKNEESMNCVAEMKVTQPIQTFFMMNYNFCKESRIGYFIKNVEHLCNESIKSISELPIRKEFVFSHNKKQCKGKVKEISFRVDESSNPVPEFILSSNCYDTERKISIDELNKIKETIIN